ncbi:putative nucleotide-diphospho-sugar transferase [Clostridium sp. YIM B02551]|uniref:putative nucleotide-diphospho-sugar transferase n=1 Tax=Clostridium sp. YIM B02551 TaxID=2910679 RepID=UPI001EEA6284|nr:putative nucleotide-diphospho-sugar transferase [Clostridium sp. YIM B02551]
MNNSFCTILSKERLYQSIALFFSLYEVMDDFCVFVLCVDDETYKLLTKINLKKIKLIQIADLNDKSLYSLRNERKLNEFCWTLKPIFIESLLCKFSSIKRITFIDSDLFFFSSPIEIFRNQPKPSILLSKSEVYVPSFSPEFNNQIQKLIGNYNSGFISFKNNNISLLCLKWWKMKCLEKCSDTIENNSFGDQKYLDLIPTYFQSVSDIKTPGVNIGHWNYAKYNFQIIDEKCFIDNSKLICYHFSGFRIMSKNDIIQLYELRSINSPFIYSIYKNTIKKIIADIQEIAPYFNGFSNEEDMTTSILKINP